MFKMKTDFLKTAWFKWTATLVLLFIIILSFFSIGLNVGFRKASFICAWNNNYPRNMMGEFGFGRMMGIGTNRNDRAGFGGPQDFMGAHGLLGQVYRLDEKGIVILDRDGVEKSVTFASTTKIMKNREEIKPTEIKVGDEVMVLGTPSFQGQIEAGLIRVLRFSDSQATTTIKK